MNLIQREKANIYNTYNRLPVAVSHAKGSKIYDVEGNEYLDMLSGIAVNALGHSHPRIIEAIQEQIQRYCHISNFFYQEPQILLAEKLNKLTNLSKTYFCNSGAEATESAIKLSRFWGNPLGKNRIITFSGGFHGRTMGTLSAMDKPLYKERMGPFLPNFDIVPINKPEVLRSYVTEETAAIMLEHIQGEGGVVEASEELIQTMIELREKYNLLLIADEVQCGIGRSGDMFAYQQYNYQPDIVITAKAIGGGLPLWAITVSETLGNEWKPGTHGTTFGGNAVACCAGMVVLDELENGVLENVQTVGTYLFEQLQMVQKEFPKKIVSIRGRGLMLGVEFSFPSRPFVEKLLEKRIISNSTSETILRIVPPLTLSKEEAQHFLDVLRNTLQSF
jgi:predicted acetylornithine/succinylornithine family transaminase